MKTHFTSDFVLYMLRKLYDVPSDMGLYDVSWYSIGV